MPSLTPVDNVLGAFFIGVVLSSMCEATVVALNFLPEIDEIESRLYGVTCLQVYLYFSQHSENDRPFLKYFVSWLLSVFPMPL